MTALAELEHRWMEILKPAPLEQRFEVMLELARAGVLAAVGLELRRAFMLAADELFPGMWHRAEAALGLTAAGGSDDGWLAWVEFCERSEAVDVSDYRTLLDERYDR